MVLALWHAPLRQKRRLLGRTAQCHQCGRVGHVKLLSVMDKQDSNPSESDSDGVDRDEGTPALAEGDEEETGRGRDRPFRGLP